MLFALLQIPGEEETKHCFRPVVMGQSFEIGTHLLQVINSLLTNSLACLDQAKLQTWTKCEKNHSWNRLACIKFNPKSTYSIYKCSIRMETTAGLDDFRMDTYQVPLTCTFAGLPHIRMKKIPRLFPDQEQNFTDLKHGNLYRNHNMLHIFFSFLFTRSIRFPRSQFPFVVLVTWCS